MSIFGGTDSQQAEFAKSHKLVELKSKTKNEEPNQLTSIQQKKQDARDLAELIYDIFKGTLSNDTIGDVSRKDKQND